MELFQQALCVLFTAHWLVSNYRHKTAYISFTMYSKVQNQMSTGLSISPLTHWLTEFYDAQCTENTLKWTLASHLHILNWKPKHLSRAESTPDWLTCLMFA